MFKFTKKETEYVPSKKLGGKTNKENSICSKKTIKKKEVMKKKKERKTNHKENHCKSRPYPTKHMITEIQPNILLIIINIK